MTKSNKDPNNKKAKDELKSKNRHEDNGLENAHSEEI